MQYLTVKEISEALHLAPSTVYKCVSLGAPVVRWGPTGRSYRIDPDQLIQWMDEQGKQREQGGNIIRMTAAQMAQRRHDLVASL